MNCRLHILELGMFHYLKLFTFSYLNDNGQAYLKSILQSSELPFSPRHRLRKFTNEKLTGSDVSLLLENIIPIVLLLSHVQYFSPHFLDSLKNASGKDFLEQRYNIDIEETPCKFLILLWKSYLHMHYSLLDTNFGKNEKEIEESVFTWREIIYCSGITESPYGKKFNVPKNHSLQELIEERKINGPSRWTETSPGEAKHKFLRSAVTISDRRNIEAFIQKSEYCGQMLRHLCDFKKCSGEGKIIILFF